MRRKLWLSLSSLPPQAHLAASIRLFDQFQSRRLSIGRIQGARRFRCQLLEFCTNALSVQQTKMANHPPFPSFFWLASSFFFYETKGLHLCKKMLPIIKNAANIRYVSQRAVCSLTLLQERPTCS